MKARKRQDSTAPALPARGLTEEEELQERTFTKEELSAIVEARLARAMKGMPRGEELAAFRRWREEQANAGAEASGSSAEGETVEAEEVLAPGPEDVPEPADASAEPSAEEGLPAEGAAQATDWERMFLAVAAGAPPSLADKYVRLAEAYEAEDFSAAVAAALLEFPAPAEKKRVPGAGANPPLSAPAARKAGRPKGTVAF